jgi:Na+-transporting methylmalonyl-CoA/oxaloacetate decarboxylase gamma subunit
MFTTSQEILTTLAVTILAVGIFCLLLSIFILARQAIGRNIQKIAKQTTILAEKGISEGVSGLVGNASLLINALNELAKSNTGIGIFLVFLSIALLTGAYFIIKPFLP